MEKKKNITEGNKRGRGLHLLFFSPGRPGVIGGVRAQKHNIVESMFAFVYVHVCARTSRITLR